MNIFNKRLARHVLEPYCTIVTGDRGAGKSTLLSLIVQMAKEQDLPVYCQYPYKDCFVLPTTYLQHKGFAYRDVDKNYLYTHDFSNSVILIDEGKTVWPARDFKNWTMQDEMFFNYIRKYNIRIFICTQSYDGLDLNVRRAADEVWYLTKGFWHFTHIESSHTTLCKVADRQTEVQGRMFKKGMRKVVWDVCEVPLRNYLFWRRPYYNTFFTDYTFQNLQPAKQESWDELFKE